MTTARIRRPPAQHEPAAMVPPRLYIATPCYGCMATTPYIASLRHLTRSLDKSGIPHTVELMGNESLITRARNKVVASFLATDCTHLIFIDADVGFQPNDLAAMVRSGFDVVVGAYPMKAIGWGNVHAEARAGRKPEELAKLGALYAVNPYVVDMASGQIDVLEREGGRYVRVEDGATGFMVIRREALERFIAHYRSDPGFAYTTDYEPVGATHHAVFQADADPGHPVMLAARMLVQEARKPNPVGLEHLAKVLREQEALRAAPGRYLSEDYWFCRKWQQMGGEVYLNIDAHLSHTGTMRFEGDVGLLFEVNSSDAGEGEANGVGYQRPVGVSVNAETVHGRRDISSRESGPVPSELQDGTNRSSAASPSPSVDRYAHLPVSFVDP